MSAIIDAIASRETLGSLRRTRWSQIHANSTSQPPVALRTRQLRLVQISRAAHGHPNPQPRGGYGAWAKS